jgi:DNA (cytosine-5)-methyltransferase 1
MIRIGSLFAGIGGFELGLERAISGSETIWQVEREPFCQKVLKKHWPNAKIYDDVRTVGSHNLESVDILCGGFPCQDISVAGRGKGLEGEKSGLWFEMLRIISELRPRVAVLENVPAITFRGLSRVLGDLAEIGYDAEWDIISARQFGAPHLRRRWFCVAYPSRKQPNSPQQIRTRGNTTFRGIITNPNSKRPRQTVDKRSTSSISPKSTIHERGPQIQTTIKVRTTTDTHSTSSKRTKLSVGTKAKRFGDSRQIGSRWDKGYSGAKILRMDDGVSYRLDKDRLKALGNAIVPQCSEYIGRHIYESGLLND